MINHIEINTAVVLAAGQGRRMNINNENNFSKPMVKLLGRPLICWIIDSIIGLGVNEIVIIKRENDIQINKIVDYYRNSNIKFIFVDDSINNGSLNSFYFAKEYVTYPFILVDSDIICDQQHFKKMVDSALNEYRKNSHLFGFVAVVDNPNNDERMLKVEENRAIQFNKKGFPDGVSGGMVYIFFMNPFYYCKELVEKGVSSYSVFFNHLLRNVSIGVMHIHEMWDVDTVEDIMMTEKILLEERA